MTPPLQVALLMIVAATCPAAAGNADAARELAPTGTLRVGVASAPFPTPLFVVKDGAGGIRGVPRDLGTALAKRLGVPAEITAMATTGELADACARGTIDIGFMPVDDERRARLDFSPPYYVIQSTYLATAASHITTLQEVDRPDVTVVGIEGSTTMRAARRTLTEARVVTAPSVDAGVAALRAGNAQALALTHDSLPPLQQQLPGSRILDGTFQTTGVAIAVHKDRPAALAAVTDFIHTSKRDGTLRRAFDAAGLGALAAAP